MVTHRASVQVPATMVRNYVRDDIERQFQQSAVAKFFDNTFVLLTLFVIVIAAGVYLARKTAPDAGEELLLAEQTMAGDATPAWLRVRDETLIPLLDGNALPERHSDIEEWIRRVDQYEFCRDIRISTPSDPSVDSELQRLIRHAFQTYADGDISGGRTELQTVHEIIHDDTRYSFLAEFVRATLNDWADEQNIAGRRDFITTMCDRANTLATQDDKSLGQLRSCVPRSGCIGRMRPSNANWQNAYDYCNSWRPLRKTIRGKQFCRAGAVTDEVRLSTFPAVDC